MHNNKEQLEIRYLQLMADYKQLVADVTAHAIAECPLKKGDTIKSIGLRYKGRKLQVTKIEVSVSRIEWNSELCYSVEALCVLLDGAGKLEHQKFMRIGHRHFGDEFYTIIKKAEQQ